MKIVINSHSKSNIALQHLLESLKENDINYCDVIVVIGGHYNLNNYEITKDENITYIRANHNSIDFTGLITLLELYSNTNESLDKESIFLPAINPMTPKDCCSVTGDPSIKILLSFTPPITGSRTLVRFVTSVLALVLVNTTVAVDLVPVDQFSTTPAVKTPPVVSPVNELLVFTVV